MYQKYNDIDVFNNSAVVYLRKSNSKIISWIVILIIGSLLFGTLIFGYHYDAYNIYFAKVIKTDEENYLSMMVDEEFIGLKNRNYLIINDTVSKCHLRDMSDNYYIYNSLKYWDVTYTCQLPDEYNVNNNIIEVKIDKGKTTIFKEVMKKIKEGITNGRTKN